MHDEERPALEQAPEEDLDLEGAKTTVLSTPYGETTGVRRPPVLSAPTPDDAAGRAPAPAAASADDIVVDVVALTKLDVLSGMPEIKVCTGYEYDGRRLEGFPASPHILDEVVPIYETLPGWQGDISGCTSFDSLPREAQGYVEYIEKGLGVPVKLIGVGQERSQTIDRGL